MGMLEDIESEVEKTTGGKDGSSSEQTGQPPATGKNKHFLLCEDFVKIYGDRDHPKKHLTGSE